jgi:multidrug transporter EmrE-like cation transporter
MPLTNELNATKHFKPDTVESPLEISLKHPKKKSPNPNEPTDNNTTESTSPSDSQDELDRRKRLLDRLFWIRIGMAALGGIIATFLFESVEGEERRWASIGFMIIVFIASAVIGKGMKIGLPHSDRKKIVTTGLGTYVFLYLFMWILSYTLVHLPATGVIPLNPI